MTLGTLTRHRVDSGRAFESGTVARLDPSAGFGYVRDASGDNSYIFLIGKAVKHSLVGQLKVGRPVRFQLSGKGRVDKLELE